MKDTINYRSLLQEKNYMKLFIANMISRFGDSLDAIAYTWMVYELTNSPTWIAIIFGINALPSILFQPFCGVLVERMNKKMIMVVTDLGRAVTVLLTALLLVSGHLNPWLLMLFTFINSTLESFRIPAGFAVYPQILPKEKYAHGTGLSSSASNVVQLIGMAAAGAIIGLVGTAGAILIDAATFLFSAIILAFLKIQATPKEAVTATSNAFFTEFKEGISYFKTKKIVLLICLLASIVNLFIIPLNTMQAVYVSDSLQLDAYGLSIIGISLTLGMALGSYLFPFITKRFSPFHTLIANGLLFSSAYIMLGFITAIPSALIVCILLTIIMLVFGIGISLMMAVVNVAFMNHVEENYLARIASIMNSMAMAFVPIGAFIMGGLTTFLDVIPLFILSGIGCMLFFILCSFNKNFRQL